MGLDGSAGLVLAAAALWRWGGGPATGGPLLADPLAWYGRWLSLAVGAILVLMTMRPLTAGGTSEYLGTLLLAVAGVMLVAEAGDLVLLVVALELISIPTYILLYLGRRDAACQESAAKYFFLSILASAMLLYGLSFLYGTTGSTQLPVIRMVLADAENMPGGFGSLVKVAMVLVFAGLSFRVAAVPFHFYAPDVYQGTTHPNAALLSVLPKAAGLLALVRLVLVAMPCMESYAWKIALVLAVATMTVGNLLALWQDNLRRLLAYSAIANAGYLLLGLAVGLATASSAGGPLGRWDGVAAMLFYLCVYAAATLGAFAALVCLGRDRQQVEAVQELAGLGRTRPLLAGCIAVFMFSLAGLPPLGGLWGKLLVFGRLTKRRHAGRRQPAALVPGRDDHRRAQRSRGGFLLLAYRSHDVFPLPAGHPQAPRGRVRMDRHLRLRGGGLGPGRFSRPVGAGVEFCQPEGRGQGSGARVYGPGARVQGSGFRVQDM